MFGACVLACICALIYIEWIKCKFKPTIRNNFSVQPAWIEAEPVYDIENVVVYVQPT